VLLFGPGVFSIDGLIKQFLDRKAPSLGAAPGPAPTRKDDRSF
jgi:hypothetical protein